MDTFKTEQFFDISQFPNKDIFDGVEDVWEVLSKLEEYIKSQFDGGLPQNYDKSKMVFIGEGTIIEEGAYIKGPAIIGKNCTIAHGAYIRDYVLTGDNVKIWHGTELKHSIMLNDSVGTHLGYIGDSIIGNRVNVASGAKTANLRLDGNSIQVVSGNEKIDTNLRKLGAIIGDDSQVGANAVLNPGTILGKKVLVYPLTSVRGVHNHNDIIK